MADDTDQITEQLENSGAIGEVSDEAEDEDTIVETLDEKKEYDETPVGSDDE